MLQGLSRPQRIVSLMSYPGSPGASTSPSGADAIQISFSAPKAGLARIAGLYSSALAPDQWTRLIARLGEIPDPTVSARPSSAAIADSQSSPAAENEGTSGGNH